MHKLTNLLYKNLANAVSILGVLPICLLFQEDCYRYLIPLMIYSNVMDDLDGVLAAKLNIKSEFGALLDNVCDSIAHSAFIMVVGMHFGGACVVASLIGVVAIVLRSVGRLVPSHVTGGGSPTNELVRHTLFVLLLAHIFEFYAPPYLIAAFLIHSVTMLMPYSVPYLIRSMTKSVLAISLLNLSLMVAWQFPSTTAVIASGFVISFLVSLATALVRGSTKVSLEVS